MQFEVVIESGGTIDTVKVTDGGSNYQLGSLITIPGDKIGGSSTNNALLYSYRIDTC